MLCLALSHLTKKDRDYEVLMTGLKIKNDNNLVGKHGNRIGPIRDIADKYGYGK